MIKLAWDDEKCTTQNLFFRVFMFEEFLSEYECDNLRRVHDRHIHLMSKEDPILCFDSIRTLQLHLKNAGKGHVKVSQHDFTQGKRS